MQPESGLKTWQWVVTAIVVIVLIIIGIMVFGKKSPTTDLNPSPTGTSTPTGAVGANSIIMSDQYPGNVVYISSAQVEKGGWIVIHADQNGKPGEVIGSAWTDAGINPVKITLTKPMIDGRTYYAMLHSDDGDKIFNGAKDLPLKDSNGNEIMRVFRATVNADQNLKG